MELDFLVGNNLVGNKKNNANKKTSQKQPTKNKATFKDDDEKVEKKTVQ